MTVTYRSKLEMIIAPQKSEKENFLVKSDYFNVDMSPKTQLAGIQFGKKYVSIFTCFFKYFILYIHAF